MKVSVKDVASKCYIEEFREGKLYISTMGRIVLATCSGTNVKCILLKPVQGGSIGKCLHFNTSEDKYTEYHGEVTISNN